MDGQSAVKGVNVNITLRASRDGQSDGQSAVEVVNVNTTLRAGPQG